MSDFLDQIQKFSENSPEAVKADSIEPKKVGDITNQIPKEMIVEQKTPAPVVPLERPAPNQNDDYDDIKGFFEEYKNTDKKEKLVEEKANRVSEPYKVSEKDVKQIIQAVVDSIDKDRKHIKNYIKEIVEESVTEVVEEILDDYFQGEEDVYEEDYYGDRYDRRSRRR